LTSRTVDECQRVGPPFEAAFEAPRADWRLEGRPRTARWYTTSTHGPLPTPEERRLCILVSLQTSPLHVGQGRLVGMGQSQAPPWMHVLFVVLRATRRPLGEAPTRSVQALAQRLGVAEADVAAMVMPTAAPATSAPPAAAPAPVAPAPLVATMAPHGASSAPRSRLSRRAVIAARKETPR